MSSGKSGHLPGSVLTVLVCGIARGTLRLCLRMLNARAAGGHAEIGSAMFTLTVQTTIASALEAGLAC